MREKNKILNDVEMLAKEFFSAKYENDFIHGKTQIPLSVPSYGWEEAYEAIESILTTWVTMGKKVKDFEQSFAQYVGVNNAHMVTSGSTANLLALSILTNPSVKNRIKPGEEIITPAVTFATTVYPIINVGAKPVLVDIEMEDINISLDQIEKAITDKTRAIMPVHLLGTTCNIKEIMEIAKDHDLFVIEDACDSSGAEIDGKKAGSYGDIGTFSFFFTHIISTMEGGMVVTNNEEYSELAKSLRAFGWIRDLKDKEKIAQKYKDIEPFFLFVNIGYNFKPTDIQGAFGIHQLKKLDKFIKIRRENAKFWTQKLKKYSDYIMVLEEKPKTKSAWYGYPIVVRPDAPFTKKDLTNFLNSKGLVTRPILSGNIAEQPVMSLFNHRKVGDLPNSRIIQSNAFFFGNHQGIGKEERDAVIDYFDEFMSKVLK